MTVGRVCEEVRAEGVGSGMVDVLDMLDVEMTEVGSSSPVTVVVVTAVVVVGSISITEIVVGTVCV